MPNRQPDRDPRADARPIVAEAARRRMILIATCTALMAVVASASGLNVAQQALAVDLDASRGDVLWIIDACVVALAAVQPDGARADALADAARQAFVDGWAASIWVGAAAMGVLFLFLALRAPRSVVGRGEGADPRLESGTGSAAESLVGARS